MPRDYRGSYSRSPRRSLDRNDYRERTERYIRNERYDYERRDRAYDHYHREPVRSRSRTRSPSRSRDRYYNNNGHYSHYASSNGQESSSYRAASYEEDEEDLCRLHVADLSPEISQYDLEKMFGKFGELKDVWMAKNPPCFAFIVYENKEAATFALKEMDQK